MKSALVKKRDNFNTEDKTKVDNKEEEIVANSNLDALDRRSSISNLSDNGGELPSSNESPNDLNNEEKEPEDRTRKNSLFDSGNYTDQPSKTGSSPSVFNEEFKGVRDEETDDQSEEESDIGSSSGNYPTYKTISSIQEDKISSSKKVSLAVSKNEFFEYFKNVSSPESNAKSSLPSHRSQNNSDIAKEKYFDPNMERVRKASIVSATPCNSETDQTLSEVEAEMRKKSIDMGRQALLKSKLSTVSSNKKTEQQKNIFENKVKEYSIKVIQSDGNLTYTMDHPNGTEFKDVHLHAREDGGIDISVSISGNVADLSQ